MPGGIRGTEGIPRVPITTQSIQTWWRAFLLLSYIPNNHQFHSNSRGRSSAVTRVLHQPGTLGSWGEVSPNGEADLRTDHYYPETQAVLSSTHHSGPNKQVAAKNNKQPGSSRTIGSIGNWARGVRCPILTKDHNQSVGFSWFHCRVHNRWRRRGKTNGVDNMDKWFV